MSLKAGLYYSFVIDIRIPTTTTQDILGRLSWEAITELSDYNCNTHNISSVDRAHEEKACSLAGGQGVLEYVYQGWRFFFFGTEKELLDKLCVLGVMLT